VVTPNRSELRESWELEERGRSSLKSPALREQLDSARSRTPSSEGSRLTTQTTLTDALLRQRGWGRGGVDGLQRLERERGITIYSKSAAVLLSFGSLRTSRNQKILLIRPVTPTFGSEVERVLRSIDL